MIAWQELVIWSMSSRRPDMYDKREKVSLEEIKDLWPYIMIVLKTRVENDAIKVHAESLIYRFAYYERYFFGSLLWYVDKARYLKAYNEGLEIEIAMAKAKRKTYTRKTKPAVRQNRI